MRRATLSRGIGMALILAAAAASSANPKPAPPTLKVLTVGGVAVSLKWDPAWIADVDPKGEREVASFNAADKLQMLTNLTMGPIPPDATPDAFRAWFMDKTSKDLLRQSVEKELKMKSFGAAGAEGVRACATDRAPKPDEYRYICQGVVTHEGHVLIFTVLYNDAGKAAADEAVAALEALQFPQGT